MERGGGGEKREGWGEGLELWKREWVKVKDGKKREVLRVRKKGC